MLGQESGKGFKAKSETPNCLGISQQVMGNEQQKRPCSGCPLTCEEKELQKGQSCVQDSPEAPLALLGPPERAHNEDVEVPRLWRDSSIPSAPSSSTGATLDSGLTLLKHQQSSL